MTTYITTYSSLRFIFNTLHCFHSAEGFTHRESFVQFKYVSTGIKKKGKDTTVLLEKKVCNYHIKHAIFSSVLFNLISCITQ